jgi:TetR/AcrR family transcriptional regulator
VSTKEKLLETATGLFAERGYDGVSIRDIAKASGCNLGAVTYHFGSKEALFGTVVETRLAPLKENVRRIAEGDDDPEQKLRQLLSAFAEHVLHAEPALRAMILEFIAGGRRLPAAAVHGIQWRNKVFATIVDDGVRQGLFQECDTELAAWSFFGMLSAYIIFEPMMGDKMKDGVYSPEFIDRAVVSALDLFLNGLKKR